MNLLLGHKLNLSVTLIFRLNHNLLMTLILKFVDLDSGNKRYLLITLKHKCKFDLQMIWCLFMPFNHIQITCICKEMFSGQK